MIDIMVGLVVVAMVGIALAYIRKQKKKRRSVYRLS